MSAARGAPISWSQARELCRSGRVTVDGRRISDDASRLAAGSQVEIAPTARRQVDGALSSDALLYADDDVVVVRKPAGMMTCPFEDGDRDTLVDRVRILLARRDKAHVRRHDTAGSSARRQSMLGVVQRLDKDTTGVLVFARTMAAKRALEEQLRVHSVERRYLAIAHGEVASQRVETYLVQDRGDGLRGSWGRFRGHAGPPPHDAKRAVTFVERRESLRGATSIECRLETGRQHQIRIHLSEKGHPLVGEPVYVRDYGGARIAAPRPMLHATSLGFVHPRTGASVRFEDPPPDDFRACLESLRRR